MENITIDIHLIENMVIDPFDLNTDQEENDNNCDDINPDEHYRDILADINTECRYNTHSMYLYQMTLILKNSFPA